MTANRNLERRIADFYATEPPLRAPDWVLRTAISTIETTPQRRGLLAPWRYARVNAYMKLAAAAAVVAVVGIAIWQLAPTGPGGTPSATPTQSPSPTPVPTASPSTAPSPYAPPALTQTFTSDIHGISISYPTGWASQPAITPWTTPADPVFLEPTGDFLYDPSRDGGHLFLLLASQPLSISFDEWTAAGLTGECTSSEPIVVDGAEGVLATGCSLAYVPGGGRVYLVRLYTSNDDADLRAFDTDAWLRDILATVQLQPADAIDTGPTPSP